MPYSDAWNVTRPAGSVLAKTIDDEIRLFRLQLQERLNDSLFVDFSTDPVVLKDGIKGLKNDIQRIIPAFAFTGDLHAKENDLSLTGFINGFCGNDIGAPLSAYIPQGSVITKLEWLIDKLNNTTVSCKLYSRPFINTAPAHTIINTTTIVSAGANVVASSALTTTLAVDTMYWLGIIGNGPATGEAYRVYGCRVTFNRASLDVAT